MSDREFDVVLYGASGFTGRQTVQYFAQHAPAGLRWAIAGRDHGRLEALKAGVPMIVADSSDLAAIDRMVSRAAVMLSTAGPFAKYSDGIVDACVRFRTDYVDITGETVWVRSLIDRYHARAADGRTRIVPCCGFDSIPSDVGAWFVTQQLAGDAAEVKAYFRMKGGQPNGGTAATGLSSFENGASKQMGDPFLLSPDIHRAPEDLETDPHTARFDADAEAWVAPFIMGPINTRVVRRTSALLGRDFAYQEYIKCTGRGMAIAIAAGTRLFEMAGNNQQGRRFLKSISPKPGTGPSEMQMDNGWFQCDFFARSRDGKTARAVVSGQGDPANRITVKCVCESALALACDREALPAIAGVLTPMSGIGEVLVRHLRAAGIRVDAE